MNKPLNSGGQLHAILALGVLILSTTLLFIPIFIIGLLKTFPNNGWRIRCTNGIDRVINCWCDLNNFYIDHTQKIDWKITGFNDFNPNEWNLVVANHQSWLDIVLLQRLFNRKIPVLKFFIKDQLKWVPLLGFCWWAMGCPFMKRYSKEYLNQNPHKKAKDMKSTHKAMEIFKQTPSAIMNFVEGTRFTPEKKLKQNSPYDHLLKPKAGGISFVISAMSEKIDKLIDVTIVYNDKKHSLWDFLCHRITGITMHIREIPIPANFIQGALNDDEVIQEAFRSWLNQQWHEKNELMNSLGA